MIVTFYGIAFSALFSISVGVSLFLFIIWLIGPFYTNDDFFVFTAGSAGSKYHKLSIFVFICFLFQLINNMLYTEVISITITRENLKLESLRFEEKDNL